MRKRFAVVGIAVAFLLGLFGVSAAQASTNGSSCDLSANWTVSSSVNWANVGGSPAVGVLKYIALSSPGVLGSTTSAVAFNSGGGVVGPLITFSSTGFSGGKYHYRSDPTSGYLNYAAVRRVGIDVQGGSARCSMTVYANS